MTVHSFVALKREELSMFGKIQEHLSRWFWPAISTIWACVHIPYLDKILSLGFCYRDSASLSTYTLVSSASTSSSFLTQLILTYQNTPWRENHIVPYRGWKPGRYSIVRWSPHDTAELLTNSFEIFGRDVGFALVIWQSTRLYICCLYYD